MARDDDFCIGDRVVDSDGKAGEVIEVNYCEGDQYLSVRFDEPIWRDGGREGGVHAESLAHENAPRMATLNFHQKLGGPGCVCCRQRYRDGEEVVDEIVRVLKGEVMHYRNGREAKNGDKIVKLDMSERGEIVAFGVLHSATPGNDYCNGGIAPITNEQGACMCDCLHVDDLAAILKEKGLHKRPAGK
jgi:hypothetical protein